MNYYLNLIYIETSSNIILFTNVNDENDEFIMKGNTWIKNTLFHF